MPVRRKDKDDRDKRQFIIQVHVGDEDLNELKKKLAKSGVKIDDSYGPYNVNPVENNFVLRGWATPKSRTAAEKIDGVTFFGDPKISA